MVGKKKHYHEMQEDFFKDKLLQTLSEPLLTPVYLSSLLHTHECTRHCTMTATPSSCDPSISTPGSKISRSLIFGDISIE